MPTDERFTLVTADEAARMLGITRHTLYKHTRAGVVPVVRLGRSCRYSLAALNKLVQSGGRQDRPAQREAICA